MNDSFPNPPIDPEMEARIVDMVLGEASVVERERLLLVIDQRPELLAFKHQIETLHGMLCDAGMGDFPGESDSWKLPDEQRSKLLDVLDGEAEMQFESTESEGRATTRGSLSQGTILGSRVGWKLTRVGAIILSIAAMGLLIVMTPMLVLKQRVATLANIEMSSEAEPASGAVELSAPDLPEAMSADELQVDGLGAFRGGSAMTWEFEPPALQPDSQTETRSSVMSAEVTKSAGMPEVLSNASSAYHLDDNSLYFAVPGNGDGELKRPQEFKESRGAPDRSANEPTTTAGLADLDDKILAPSTDLDDASKSALESRRGEIKVSDEITEAYSRSSRFQMGLGRSVEGAGKSLDIENGTLNPYALGKAEPDSLMLGVMPNIFIDSEEEAKLGDPYAGRKYDSGTNLNLGQSEMDRIGDSIDYVLDADRSGGQIDAMASSDKGLEVELGYAFNQAEKGLSETNRPGASLLAKDENQLFERLPYLALQSRSGWSEMDVKGLTAQRERVLERLERAKTTQMYDAPIGPSHRELVDYVQSEDKGRQLTQSAAIAVPPAIREIDAVKEPFSTFSLHVSDVSFKLAQSALSQGEWPAANKVRIEEFVNAFDYGDPLPREGEAVSCVLEQAIHPFLQQRNTLRIAMRTAAEGRSSNTPLRLTFLLDNSGSMERMDRQQTVLRAFELLAQQAQPFDQMTLISFSRQPRLLADKVPGGEVAKLLDIIRNTPSEGGTNIESALQLAFEKAIEQKTEQAQNRIVMLTDGAVNLGDANPERLSQMVESMRDSGIAFDAAGISAEGLNDEVLEALTRKGDGRYYLLDSPNNADENFAKQIAGALRPSAKNVKVQVEFNPERVGRYKLLGFEKHRLNTEDFRNDKVDAAEMAAAEAGVAVYQFEPKPNGEGDVGSVSVRFQDLSTGQMIEHRWPIAYQADVPRIDQATPSLRIAAVAALFAAKLRGEPLGECVDLATLASLMTELPQSELAKPRVVELQTMIQQARQISGR